MGNDLDIITWEQSMNCGRDAKPTESFIRASIQSMKKMPTIMFLTSGTPSWTEKECVNISSTTSRPPFSYEENKLQHKSIKEILTSNSRLQAMPFIRPSSTSQDLSEVYRNVGIMGQSVLGVGAYKCYGPYNATFSSKTPGDGASWHPGRLGHKLRGDNIAYVLLNIFEEAVSMIRSNNGDHTKLMDFYRETDVFLDNMYDSLTAEKLVKPVYCDGSVCSQTPTCYTNFEPKVKNSLTSIVHSLNSSSSWTNELSFNDVKAVQKAINKGLGYIDRKYIYLSHKVNDELSFDFNVTRSSSIWMCQSPKNFGKYPSNIVDLDMGSEIYDKMHGGDKKTLIKLKKYADECYVSVDPFKAGSHVVSISQKYENQSVRYLYRSMLSTNNFNAYL